VPANVTSYVSGINGIMIDMTRLVNNLEADDFEFRMGNTTNPSAWGAAPGPLSVTERPSGRADGATRVTIIWADGAIKNQWLQVTVKANNITGLAAPDVFYFGNQVGETGDSPTTAAVTAADYTDTRALLGASSGIGGRYDFNRDGRVNTTDVLLIRGAMFGSIPLLGAPAALFAEASIAPAASSAVVTGTARTTLAARRTWYEQPADVLA